jgi:phenylacetate-CoA ligase
MLVVRGVNVFPTAVRTVLMNFLDELTGQYQIVLETPPPLQTILVRAEHRAPGSVAAGDAFQQRLLESFRSQMNISPRLDFVPAGSLPRTEGKTNLCVKNYRNP